MNWNKWRLKIKTDSLTEIITDAPEVETWSFVTLQPQRSVGHFSLFPLWPLTSTLQDEAQVLRSRAVLWLTDWLTDSSLCPTGSTPPPSLGANTRSSEEFWGNLCTVSRLIELAASCRQCVHCEAAQCWASCVQRPPHHNPPTPPTTASNHWLFILFQSVIGLRLHHWTIINPLREGAPPGGESPTGQGGGVIYDHWLSVLTSGQSCESSSHINTF